MNAQNSSLNLAVHETENVARTLSLGPSVERSGVIYTAWAPTHETIMLNVNSGAGVMRSIPMEKKDSGIFRAVDSEGRPGDLYVFEIDGGEQVADFASRFQPYGGNGPSLVTDPHLYRWENGEWRRPRWKGQVIYDLHVGAFTPEGTYRAAINKLRYIKTLGPTAIEIIPLAERMGERNWEYDGVLLFAPTHSYGTPDARPEWRARSLGQQTFRPMSLTLRTWFPH